MGFLKPKIPAMPALPPVQPLPEPPSYEDADRAAAEAAKRAKLRASTILTGTDGLEDDDSKISKKTLLGG